MHPTEERCALWLGTRRSGPDFPPRSESFGLFLKNTCCARQHLIQEEMFITKNGVLGMLRDWTVPQVVLRTRVLLGMYKELVSQGNWHWVSHVSATNILQRVSQAGGTVERGCMRDAVFRSL